MKNNEKINQIYTILKKLFEEGELNQFTNGDDGILFRVQLWGPEFEGTLADWTYGPEENSFLNDELMD